MRDIISHHYFEIDAEIIFEYDAKSRSSGAGSFQQAQNKSEPRLNPGGISLTLNLPT